MQTQRDLPKPPTKSRALPADAEGLQVARSPLQEGGLEVVDVYGHGSWAGLEVVPRAGLEVACGEGIQLAQFGHVEKEVSHRKLRKSQSSRMLLGNQLQTPKHRRRICGLPPRWFYALATFITLAVVSVAVSVGVDQSNPKHTPAAVSTSPPSPGELHSAISNGSMLAVVSYQEGTEVTLCRVFYQDEPAYIKESAWDSTENEWYISNNNVTKAQPETPLAAAAYSLSNGTTVTSLFYVQLNHTISSIIKVSGDDTWRIPGYNPPTAFGQIDSDSKLAAAMIENYNCSSCSYSTVLAFQSGGNITIASLNTDAGYWNITILQVAPANGTHLSLCYVAPDSLGLWYESISYDLEYLTLSLGMGNAEWIDQGPFVHKLVRSSPIVALPYDALGSNNASFYQVTYFLDPTSPTSLNATGLMNNTTLPNHSMSSYEIEAFSRLQANNTILAANAAGRIYTLVDRTIEEWQMKITADGKWTTTSLGNVPTVFNTPVLNGTQFCKINATVGEIVNCRNGSSTKEDKLGFVIGGTSYEFTCFVIGQCYEYDCTWNWIPQPQLVGGGCYVNGYYTDDHCTANTLAMC